MELIAKSPAKPKHLSSNRPRNVAGGAALTNLSKCFPKFRAFPLT